MAIAKLLRAKQVKNDEFYTQYEDIKSECDHYRPHYICQKSYNHQKPPHGVF